MLKKIAVTLSIALIATLMACGRLNTPTQPGEARADLIGPEGQLVGTATLSETDEGVKLELDLVNMPPGEHGFHIHETGECAPPDFQSAGGHLALAGQSHGFDTGKGPHLGDLPNLTVAASGSAEIHQTVDGATLGGGDRSLMNRAIVIHAKPDDYKSQPSGAAGARIACGVIEAGFALPVTTRPFPVH